MLKQEEIAEEKEMDGVCEVQTPSGWSRILKMYKTIPLEIYEIKTETYTLKCSKHHLVYHENGYCIEVCDIIPGKDRIGVLKEITGGVEYEVVLSVTATGEKEPLYDITIENEDGLFFSNGILSHNSTTFCARQIINAHLIPGLSSLYIAPHEAQNKTYSDRLLQMESMFCKDVGKQNKYSKKYVNGSTIRLESCLTSADNIRGMTVDDVLIDECQGMDPDIIPEILATQTMSTIKTTIYAGTALNVDTLLEQKWQDSSMGIWHVRAGDGKSWLNLYDKETLFAICSNPEGPRCPITSKPLIMTNGCFVHAKPAALEEGRVGLHIPQCIIPDISNNRVRWEELYMKVKRQDPKKVLQECFGIAVSEGSREISERDLMRICTLEDTEEQLKAKCRSGFYRLVVSGCDWGGSDWNPQTKTKTSYTVHCILGLAPDGTIDILHYRRFAGMDYEDIANIIVEDHKAFNGFALASDFGVGMLYNIEMRKRLPMDRHFIIAYSSPSSAAVAEPKGPHLPNQLSVNRTEAITSVFRDLKRFDPQRIRCRNWGDMQEFLLDWLNMHRVPSETPSGQTTFKYIRVPSKADDALHAFTFAYVLIKTVSGEQIVQDPLLEEKIRRILSSSTYEAMLNDAIEEFGDVDYIVSG